MKFDEENTKRFIPELHDLRMKIARDFQTLKNTYLVNEGMLNVSKGVEFSLIHLIRSRMWLKEAIRYIETAEPNRPLSMTDDDRYTEEVVGSKFESVQGIQGWLKIYAKEIQERILSVEKLWFEFHAFTFQNVFLEQVYTSLVEVKMWIEYELQSQKKPEESHASQS